MSKTSLRWSGIGAIAASLAWAIGASTSDLSAPVPDESAGVTAEDYSRAERFLHWNRDRYVFNADIQHHWIGGEDRFWYLRTKASGEKEFVLVEAASGKQSLAFDHKRIATALSAAGGQKVDPYRLPFSTFGYTRDRRAIQFQVAQRIWTCKLHSSVCDVADPLAAPNELLSPNGKWAAFREGENVGVREVQGGRGKRMLTQDGVEHYGYGGFPGYSTHAVTDRRHPEPAPPQVVWSPDSRFLLTYRLDERKVRDLYLVQSVPEDGSARPKLYSYRYALPGDEHLPTLELVVIDVASGRKVALKSPPILCGPQTPIEKRNVWWSADGAHVYFIDRDRFSKYVSLRRGDPVTGMVSQVLEERSSTVLLTNAGSVFDFPVVKTLRNGDVIWYSHRNGWGHLYYYDRSGTLKNPITRGHWIVRGLVRVDEPGERVYFMASGREPGDPYEQRLYSVRFDGSDLRLLTPEPADHMWPHVLAKWPPASQPETEREQEQFSASGRYFVDSYSRPDLPPVLVVRKADGELVAQLERADVSKLRERGYVPVEPFEARAADGKTSIYGNLFRPSTFDPDRRYPVIDACYPGPQGMRTDKSFTATSFNHFEAQSLAELGFIVVTIDGRGTPNRSRAFMDHSHGRLHKASDLDDHIAAIRELARRYPYIDLGRVGIDGVSGGGFMAAQAVLTYPDFYKVAVAAEGNHDQRGYLAPWGESYIGKVGGSDYESASTISLAPRLRGKLMLMHGELDDNVSPSLTLKLVDALVKANKDFDLLILPNANHTASFTSTYFIRRKWDFFVRNLLHTEPPAGYLIEGPK